MTISFLIRWIFGRKKPFCNHVALSIDAARQLLAVVGIVGAFVGLIVGWVLF